MKDKEQILDYLTDVFNKLKLKHSPPLGKEATETEETALEAIGVVIQVLEDGFIFLPENLQEVAALEQFSEHFGQLQNGQQMAFALHRNKPNNICRS